MDHRWKYQGTDVLEFPFHGLTDEDGNPVAAPEPGDVVHTDRLGPCDSDPRFVRLDKPAAKKTSKTDDPAVPVSDDAAPAATPEEQP